MEFVIENKYANYTLEEKVKAAVELITDHINMQHRERTSADEYMINELTELYNSL